MSEQKQQKRARLAPRLRKLAPRREIAGLPAYEEGR